MTRTKLGVGKNDSNQRLSQVPITLDSTTWIFDDRKVKLKTLKVVCLKERNQLDSNNREWNRAILEGQTNPPTLNSEIKYRKRSVLEDSFAINMTPFFKITEPKDNATAIKLFNDESSIEVPIELLPYLFSNLRKMESVCMMIMQ